MDEAAQLAVSKLAPLPLPKQIPTVIAGKFNRSISLLKQVQLLNQDLEADYIIISGRKEPAGTNPFVLCRAICLSGCSPIQALFRVARNKAITTGDRDCVMVLCHYILWLCTNCPGLFESIREVFDQLDKEWEVPDMKKLVLELDERRCDDPYGRP